MLGEKRFKMGHQHHFVHTARGPIEYTRSGEGEVCLLIHGGHSNCFEVFGTEEIQAAKMSALIPSRPGYGNTPAQTGKTASDAAEALISLLDALSISRVSLVAISAGGPTALYLAAMYPQRINKLVLESAVSRKWLQPDDALYRTAKIIFNSASQGMTWQMLRTLWRLSPNTVLKQMIPSFSTLPTDDVLSLLSTEDRAAFSMMLQRQGSGSGFMLDLEHDIARETLQKIEVPTLIVHSKTDNSVGFEHAEYAGANIAKSELLEAHTWGHLIWLGAGNDEVKTKVAEFLQARFF